MRGGFIAQLEILSFSCFFEDFPKSKNFSKKSKIFLRFGDSPTPRWISEPPIDFWQVRNVRTIFSKVAGCVEREK